MNLLAKEVKIEIFEPWPKDEILTGRVTKFFQTKTHRQYLVIHNDINSENYLVNNRHDYQIDKLRANKTLIVNVVKIINLDTANLEKIDWDNLDNTNWMLFTEIVGIGVLRVIK